MNKVTDFNAKLDEHPMLSARASSSRKLLARKALVRQLENLAADEALEASFPTENDPSEVQASSGDAEAQAMQLRGDNTTPPHSAEATMGEKPTKLHGSVVSRSPAPVATNAQPAPLPTPAWSAEDESTFQALIARRKAAGYQRRGRDVRGQLLSVGSIKPNPDTVVAAIVGIVIGCGGNIGRDELIDAMITATFAHTKTQPSNRSWCQGYVAGAIRNGFLTVVEQAPVTAQAV